MEKGLPNKARKQSPQNGNNESSKEDTAGDLVLDQDEIKLKTQTLNEEEEVAKKKWIEDRKEVTTILSYFADYR